MNPVLKLLLDGVSLTTAQIAQVAGLTEAEVQQHLEQLKKDKIFLGWRPVLDLSREAAAAAAVRAVIEVKVTPERGGGFNRFAERIARFDEVEACYLMPGGYDLLVFVRGASLQKVAAFVSEKLSTIEGVLSTSTHFMLRCYKEQGFLLESDEAQVIVTGGVSEALDLAFRAFCNPGDKVMFHQPCYVSYHPSITLVHGEGIAVPTFAKDNFALTAEALRAAWQPGAKILMLNLPCNPTGGTCSREQLEKIAEFCRDKDLLVLRDEIYFELTFDGTHTSIATFPSMVERKI